MCWSCSLFISCVGCYGDLFLSWNESYNCVFCIRNIFNTWCFISPISSSSAFHLPPVVVGGENAELCCYQNLRGRRQEDESSTSRKKHIHLKRCSADLFRSRVHFCDSPSAPHGGAVGKLSVCQFLLTNESLPVCCCVYTWIHVSQFFFACFFAHDAAR